MNVLITSIGSAGDINPFIAIGRALRRRGHRVRVLVNPYFREQVAAADLEFLPLGTEAQFRRLVDLPCVRRPRKGSPQLWREHTLPNVPPLLDAIEAQARDDPPDVVLYHPLSLGALWICRRYEIPTAVAALSPLAWMSRRDGSVHSRTFVNRTAPGWLVRGYLWVVRMYLRWMIDRDLNRIRRQRDLPPMRDIFFDSILNADAGLGMWSPVFRGPAPDDPPNARICGFQWFDHGHQVSQTDDELTRFLETGAPPIVFTMGTTVVTAAGGFYEHAAEACRRLGRRGLLLTGSAENAPKRLPPGVRAFPYAPFSLVLPRACATVHHGGVGTTGQALRSGKPTVVIPVAYDQFDNAARLKRLGVSETLLTSRVTPKSLAAALQRVLQSPAITRRAEELASKLVGEDGAAVAAEELERLVARAPSTLKSGS